MATPFITLDRLTMVAPLGLRFHDTVSGNVVGDGLSVWAYPPEKPAAKQRALGNRRGVYVLHHGYGLRGIENGDGTQLYWDNNPPSRDFVIQVSDDERRFQPFQFTATLPVRGVFEWNGFDDSPPSARSSVPLFSSPVRNVPGGMAVIRAELWDTAVDGPAAWAVFEAYDAGRRIAQGVADEKGRVVLIFSYPAPITFASPSPPGSPLGSPPVASGPPLTEQVWPLGLRALYTPVRPVSPVSSPLNSTEPDQSFPDLRFTLSQPEATLWADAALSEVLLETNLRFGRELILKSRPILGSPLSATRDSVLFITPAVSPP
jgi:hypothetical protein